MTTKKSTRAHREIEVSLPVLELNPAVTWEYRLTAEGFETRISVELSDRTITMSDVMSWDVFINGLALGWEKHHQHNPEFTRLIDIFIRRQIEAGNYTARSQEEGV